MTHCATRQDEREVVASPPPIFFRQGWVGPHAETRVLGRRHHVRFWPPSPSPCRGASRPDSLETEALRVEHGGAHLDKTKSGPPRQRKLNSVGKPTDRVADLLTDNNQRRKAMARETHGVLNKRRYCNPRCQFSAWGERRLSLAATPRGSVPSGLVCSPCAPASPPPRTRAGAGG